MKGTTNASGTLTYAWNEDHGTGTFTVKAEYEDATTPQYPNYVGEATFEVSPPRKLNVFVKPATLTPGASDIQVFIYDAYGEGLKTESLKDDQIKHVTINVTGPVSEPISFDSKEDTFDPGSGNTRITFQGVNIEQAGTITISGTVTFGNESTSQFAKTITVEGYNVDVTRNLGTLGDIVTLKAVVTNQDGTPINNAVVTFDHVDPGYGFILDGNGDGKYTEEHDRIVIDGTRTNIIQGTYEARVKLAQAGTVEITVTRGDTTKAKVLAVINGKNVYTVKCNRNWMIATYRQDLDITVTDQEGNIVTTLDELEVTGGGLASPLTISDALLIDTDNDGRLDTYRFRGLLPAAPEDLTVTAYTDGGNRLGTLTIPVSAPSLEVTPKDSLLTESVTETVELQVKDLGDNGKPLSAIIELKMSGLSDKTIFESKDFNSGGKAISVTSASFTIKAFPDRESSGEPGIAVFVSYDPEATPIRATLNGDPQKALEFHLLTVSIGVDKDKVYMGQRNNLVVTLKDAHGKPLADRTVELLDTVRATGTTDESGAVRFVINPNSTGKITIDAGGTTSREITVVADNEKPTVEVSIPEITSEETILLRGTISDNNRVEKLYVNNKQVIFLPASRIDLDDLGYMVKLKEGVNTIRILAFDSAGNGTQVEKETIYRKKRTINLFVNSYTAEVDGRTVTLDQPPSIVNHRTLVPLRFIGEVLGGYVTWDSPYASVTIDGKMVAISCNESVYPWATINTIPVEIDQPGIIVNHRALVPVRFVAEAFGARVKWFGTQGRIEIIY